MTPSTLPTDAPDARSPRPEDLICAGGTQYSEVLIRRLVDILRAGGERQSVVLSSSWRKSKHSGIVEQLQHEISKHLAEVFEFHARTEAPIVAFAPRPLPAAPFRRSTRGCGKCLCVCMCVDVCRCV